MRGSQPTRAPLAVVLPFAVALVAVALPARAAAPPPLLGHPVGYVIVTSRALAPSFAPLVDWKIRKGLPTAVKTIEDIRVEYPVAADDAERVRMFLQDARTAGTLWVLIGGDTDVIPIRYAKTTFFGGVDLPTDLYYACLDGNWNADGDAFFGEGYFSASNPGDNADMIADVYVGRAPVRTPAEASRVVTRTLQYERTPAGDYEDSRTFAAEVLFPYPWIPGNPINFDGAEIVEPLLPVFTAKGLPVTRLYQNYSNPLWQPGALPENRSAVRNAMNAGSGFVSVIGHGSSTLLSTGPDMVTTPDVMALTNATRPFPAWLLSSQVCQPDSETIGEALLRAPGGGAVACVGNGHYGFPTADRIYFEAFMRVVHDSGEVRFGRALARARLPFVPFTQFDGVNRWAQMTNELLGDPELPIWRRRPQTLTVLHPPSLAPGQSVTVVVTSGGSPIVGARVTLYQAGHLLVLLHSNSSGVASAIPVGAVDGTIAVTVSVDDYRPYEGTSLYGTVTATTASLARSDVTPERAVLTWDAPGWPAAGASLERSGADGGPWLAVGRIESGGVGIVVGVDEAVRPGARYRYRLRRTVNGAVEYSAEAAIEVPAALRLALGSVAPNPVERGACVSLALAGGKGARLEVFDLAGRVRWSRGLAGVAGPQRIALDGVERLPAGVYVIRLSESGISRSHRLVVL